MPGSVFVRKATCRFNGDHFFFRRLLRDCIKWNNLNNQYTFLVMHSKTLPVARMIRVEVV